MASLQCISCKHWFGIKGGCKAFPEGIPWQISQAVHDHKRFYPGDGGIRYEEANAEESEKIMAAR